MVGNEYFESSFFLLTLLWCITSCNALILRSKLVARCLVEAGIAASLDVRSTSECVSVYCLIWRVLPRELCCCVSKVSEEGIRLEIWPFDKSCLTASVRQMVFIPTKNTED